MSCRCAEINRCTQIEKSILEQKYNYQQKDDSWDHNA